MTIEVADCQDIKIDLNEDESRLTFSAVSNGEKFAFDMVLYDKVIKEESKWNTKGRNVFLSISKKDKEQEEWWPRLTKEKIKNPLITIDWSKWVDPDEEDENPNPTGMGGDFDPSQMQDFMQGMGGMGGMGGMAGNDSDDEDGEEAQIEPHLPGEEKKGEDKNADLDDLEGEETADLKK